jgi:hypothetical protein
MTNPSRTSGLLPAITAAIALYGLALAAAPQLIEQGPPPPLPRDFMSGPPPSQPQGTATISGVVVSADLGRPIRRATVRLSSTVPAPPVTVTADDQGRFVFERVPAGQFTIVASKPGYLDSEYGQKKPGSGRPGTPLSISEGQRVERLSLPIARGGVLAGVVVDDGGEPAFGTEVRALRYTWQNGERVLRPAGSARADDRGSFRIGALPPGEYVVMATPAGQAGPFDDFGPFSVASAPMAVAGTAINVAVAREAAFNAVVGPVQTQATSGYAPVYYPGTTTSSGATTVTLGISEERAGMDLQLQLVPLGTVSGMVVGDGTRSASGTEVRLTSLDNALPGLGVRATFAAPDGAFTFMNVPPGRYRVTARAGARQEVFVDDSGGQTRMMMQFTSGARGEGPRAGGPPAAQPARWASADVSLTGRETQNVTLQLQPGVTVSGRVVFDRSTQAPENLATIRVVLNTANASDGPASALAAVNADGRFSIEGVVPGRYRVSVLAPGGLRAASFDVGGEDALDFLLNVGDRSPADATLTLTSRAAAIAGSLRQASGQPASDYTILVFADDPRYWTPQSRRIQATRPATDGAFSFRNLPGGAYRIVAVDDLEDGQWLDPAVLRQVSAAAIPITVADGETKTQDLRVAR